MMFNKKKRLFPCCSTFLYKMSKYNDFQDELRNVAQSCLTTRRRNEVATVWSWKQYTRISRHSDLPMFHSARRAEPAQLHDAWYRDTARSASLTDNATTDSLATGA